MPKKKATAAPTPAVQWSDNMIWQLIDQIEWNDNGIAGKAEEDQHKFLMLQQVWWNARKHLVVGKLPFISVSELSCF
jgi:hypothetical protein